MGKTETVINLHKLREELREWTESMRMPGTSAGVYRFTPEGDPHFYASADAAIIRWIIGDDLQSMLNKQDRLNWIAVINDCQEPGEGRFVNDFPHHPFHAMGMGLNALVALGGQCRYPMAYFKLFNKPDVIGPWLSSLPWGTTGPWDVSHIIWGGPVFLNMSSKASVEWRQAMFDWFDRQLDEYGAWAKDFPVDLNKVQIGSEYQALGCSVHVWPLWRHLGLRVPGVERIAKVVLDLQGERNWGGVHYGSMDAFYILMVAAGQDAGNADIYHEALNRFIPTLMDDYYGPRHSFSDMHKALCWASCVGYLRKALPDRFVGGDSWNDIFDVAELYDFDAVHPHEV